MNRYYYVGSDRQAHGPILPTEFLDHGLNADSLVCQEGGTVWVPLRDIPGLTEFIRVAPQQQGVPPSGRPYPDEYAHKGGYGAPTPDAPVGFAPPTNMVWAVLTTVLCCLPFGIVAIVKASQVSSLWMQGRYEEARAASKAAGIWSIVAAACGVVGTIVYLLYFIVIGVATDGGVFADFI